MEWISVKDRLPEGKQLVMITIRCFMWEENADGNEVCNGDYYDQVTFALFDPYYVKPFDVPYLVCVDGTIDDVGTLQFGFKEKRKSIGFFDGSQYSDGPDDYVLAWAPLPKAYKED